MNRRTEVGLWIALIVVAALAGVAIAGMPDLGAASEPAAGVSPQSPEADEPARDAAATSTTLATTTTALPTTTTTTTTTTTNPPPELRPNAEVTVLVVNGTSVVGAAGRLTDQVAAEGHPVLTPTSTSESAVSEVWFTGDYGPEAADLAERIGVFPENVRLIPDDAGISIGTANVVVVIGPDLA